MYSLDFIKVLECCRKPKTPKIVELKKIENGMKPTRQKLENAYRAVDRTAEAVERSPRIPGKQRGKPSARRHYINSTRAKNIDLYAICNNNTVEPDVTETGSFRNRTQ